MTEIHSIARKWGNSLGIIIPKEVVEQENITENEPLTVILQKKKPIVQEFFGLCPTWKRPTSEIKREMKKGWM